MLFILHLGRHDYAINLVSIHTTYILTIHNFIAAEPKDAYISRLGEQACKLSLHPQISLHG